MTLHTDSPTSLEQIERSLAGTDAISCRAPDRAQRRAWIERVLRQFAYSRRRRDLGRGDAPGDPPQPERSQRPFPGYEPGRRTTWNGVPRQLSGG